MKFLKLLIFLTLIYVNAKAQLDSTDFASRKMADFVANAVLKDSTSYALFSVADKRFILIKKEKQGFKEYFVVLTDSGFVKIEKSVMLNSVKRFPGKKILDFSLYRKDYTTFSTDFYKNGYENASGGMIYFVAKDSFGNRHGETRVSFITKPNLIPTEIYHYFVDRSFYYSKVQ